jgi:hypothetical protein
LSGSGRELHRLELQELHRLELQDVAAEAQQIVRRFAGVAGAGRADVEQVPAERGEQRPAGAYRAVVAPHDDGEQADGCLLRAAADRRVDQVEWVMQRSAHGQWSTGRYW